MTIGIIDTGIDLDSPEFVGRISAASTDIYGTRDVEGPDDHGTSVALISSAARNSTGILGIAFESTILAIRADAPGTCGGDNPEDPNSDCQFADNRVAQSIDYAVANGAKVVNISLGSDGEIGQQLQAAVRAAVNDGVLVVVAAGNEGFDRLANFAASMQRAGDGGVLVVGSVDENYVISDFSNKPGVDQQFFIAARGEAICCVYEDGSLFIDEEGFAYLFSGTSFASPQVAGAAALLAQAFPHLTGRQIAEILLESAFDAGAAGSDPIYGRGILDIARAFQPIGTTAIAGQTTAFSLADGSAISSPAMGDAFQTATLPTLVTDRFSRAFQTDLAGTLSAAEQRPRLHGAVGQSTRSMSAGSDQASVAFTIDARGKQGLQAEPLRLSGNDAERARVLAAQVAMRVAPDTQLAFSYRGSADNLMVGLQGRERPAFMIAGDGARDTGMLSGSDASFALRQRIGEWGLGIGASTGSTLTAGDVRRAAQLRSQRVEEDLENFHLAIDRRFGAFDTALGLTWTGEDRTVLGARFHEGFGLAGSDSLFLDGDLGWQFATQWRFGMAYRQGFTSLRIAPLVADGSRLKSNGWSLDLSREGLFSSGDALAFRLAQPLRVTGGGLNLLLPSGFDYETLAPDYTVRTLSLSPEGRELVGELSWRGRLLNGNAAASIFYRDEPGHFESAPADAGVAVRWSREF